MVDIVFEPQGLITRLRDMGPAAGILPGLVASHTAMMRMRCTRLNNFLYVTYLLHSFRVFS